MRLQFLDVFAKTAEDARVRTSGGGAVSIAAGLLLSWLLLLQVRSYFAYTWEHALTVDTRPEEKMVLALDLTLANLPCELVNVDTIDSNSDRQEDVDDGLQLIDLDALGRPLDAAVKERQAARRQEAIALRGPDYEGACYGCEDGLRRARDLARDAPVKCMTCQDIHDGYSELGWGFHDGRGFAQCVEEGFPDAVQENKDNGCRVSGNILVSKVKGAIHIAPGDSHWTETNSVHSHDLSTFSLDELPYDFTHTIDRLTFAGTDGLGSAASSTDPLQDYVGLAPEKQFQFRYFLSVVGTEYEYANGTVVHTNQYAVTHHERPLRGGRDEDHPNSVHSKGGVPGITFSYDISPLKVREKQLRQQSFGTLLMNIFAIVGAVITTAAVVDKGVYAVDQALKARKDR